MHGSIRDQLEKLLADGASNADCAGLPAHLAECRECSVQLNDMRTAAQHLRTLRAPEELEVSAGFYARVLERIEQRTSISAWAAFLYSPFSRRLAYGSLSAALIITAYLFTAESIDGHIFGETASTIRLAPQTSRVFGSQSEQRDAVLVNFASYQESSQ